MEYTIYVITNEVNGKEYVGVTSQGVEHRWAQHKSSAQRGVETHLYNAMRKYGAEGFLIQSVEHAEAQDKAFDLEKQWIADLDTYHGQGYNMSEGGESPPHLTGEDNPMYGRTGEDAPMYGRGDLVSGENNGMYGRGDLVSGEDHPMYGRTGENASNSSLSRKEAAQIKWYALATERTQRNIGARFGISARQVGHIKNGSRWPNLDPKPPADNGQLRLPLGAT